MKKNFAKNIGIYLALFAVVLMVAFFYKGADADQVSVKEVPLSKFVQYLDKEQISEINFTDTKLTGKISEKEFPEAGTGRRYSSHDDPELFRCIHDGAGAYGDRGADRIRV